MRPLTIEEILYLADQDKISMTRLPILQIKLDEGSHTYDKEEDMDWKGNGNLQNREICLMACKDRIPRQSYSLTLVLQDSRLRTIGIVTINLEDYIERDRFQQIKSDYPASIRDILRIGLLSGACGMTIVFNHPDQNLLKANSLKFYEEELMLAAGLMVFDNPPLYDIFAVNMDQDPSVNFPNMVPRYKSGVFSKELTKAYGKYGRSFVKEAVKTGKTQDTDSYDTDFDFTFGGKLLGMDQDHLDRWLFYTDRRQKEPIRYEEWKMGEISFTADLLMDPNPRRHMAKAGDLEKITASYVGKERMLNITLASKKEEEKQIYLHSEEVCTIGEDPEEHLYGGEGKD